MPIFEFKCKACENQFKALRRSDRLDEVRCPECGAGQLMRLLSVTAQPTGDTVQMDCSAPGGACCGMGSACARR